MSCTSLGGTFRSISITPCGNTTRASAGKIRVKASAFGKLIMRRLGFPRNEWTAVASGAPRIHTASTLPSFIASTAADPAKGNNVAVSEFTPPLPRIAATAGQTVHSRNKRSNMGCCTRFLMTAILANVSRPRHLRAQRQSERRNFDPAEA